MVLTPESLSDARARARSRSCVAFLWDIGLAVGHSVRTINECASESLADVGVMTTLLEARWLAGSATLLPAMRAALAPDRLWPVRDYFAAKVREQQERHRKANDTAYNLEPNVKTGPGGLRDIQTIAWVAKRHFGSESLDELATHGFLTAFGAAPAEAGAGVPVEGALRPARADRAARRPVAVRSPDQAGAAASATRTATIPSRSSS